MRAESRGVRVSVRAGRRDGDSLGKLIVDVAAAAFHPAQALERQARHAGYALLYPVDHLVGHLRAAAHAASEGRLIDAGVALINDGYEKKSLQPASAFTWYGWPAAGPRPRPRRAAR